MATEPHEESREIIVLQQATVERNDSHETCGQDRHLVIVETHVPSQLGEIRRGIRQTSAGGQWTNMLTTQIHASENLYQMVLSIT